MIICDWHLPDMEGRQILQRFKQQEATAKVPVIVITADLMAISTDALEVLRKPFQPQVLLNAIDRALKQKSETG